MERLDQRLSKLETGQDQSEKAMTRLTERVSDIEEWLVQRRIAEAREDERDKALYERLNRFEATLKEVADGLEAKINKIGEFGMRIFWVAATPVVVAIVIAVALAIMWEFKLISPPNLGVGP